jgi:polyhydroxybutyrate depolymerase
MNSRNLGALFVTQLLLMGCAVNDSNPQPSSNEAINGQDLTFDHQGGERTYKIYKPTDLPDNAPMLFVLHGLGGKSGHMYRIGFNELAEKHGFLAVFPQSLRKIVILDRDDAKLAGLDLDEICRSGKTTDDWMKYICVDGKLVSTAGNVRWNDTGTDSGEDDVAFLSALAVHLQERFGVNSDQTFVSGFSNGAYMSYTLLCQAGDVFKGAAPVSGLSQYSVLDKCNPQGPKPLLHIHGVNDGLVPISGKREKDGRKGGKARSPSVEELVGYFAKLNSATRKETVQATKSATLYKYLAEDDGFEVHFYRIENHGHEWPGSPNRKSGKDTSGFKATEVIWAFFSQLSAS